MTNVDVVTAIEIELPVAVVSAFAADPSNVTEWYTRINSVEWVSEPGVVEVGASAAFVARFLGRTLRYTYRVEHFDPNRKMTMRTAEGPFPMETTYEWLELEAGRTRMTLRNRGEPTGFSRWVAPMMAAAMRRANKQDLERLKRVLEADCM